MDSLPIVKTKIIRHHRDDAFEESVDSFIKDKLNYNIQYKPVTNHEGYVIHLALIIYETQAKEE